MAAKDIELEITQIFASALTLEIDSTIFRGFVPARKTDALGVIVGGAASGNWPVGEDYPVQLLGRWIDRDAATEMCRKIDAWLPRYDSRFRIVKESSGVVYASTANGKDVWEMSYNLQVHLVS